MKHDQFTLPFLDTTSLGGSLSLYGGFPTAGFPTTRSPALPEMTFEPDAAEIVDPPDPAKPTVPAHDYRLAGDRRLAQSWKARARDNLAAIRLLQTIEAKIMTKDKIDRHERKRLNHFYRDMFNVG